MCEVCTLENNWQNQQCEACESPPPQLPANEIMEVKQIDLNEVEQNLKKKDQERFRLLVEEITCFLDKINREKLEKSKEEVQQELIMLQAQLEDLIRKKEIDKKVQLKLEENKLKNKLKKQLLKLKKKGIYNEEQPSVSEKKVTKNWFSSPLIAFDSKEPSA